MAATFSNPRWDALPCEMMRGCSFADDFLTEERIEQNNGASGGGGGTVDHGLTFTGSGFFEYDIVTQPSGFSVTVRFLTTYTVTTRGPLIRNATAGTAGFWIYLTPTGVLAQHGNGSEPHDACEVAISYADGEIHTVTYVVDMTSGTHSLYVDALDVATETTAIDEEIGDVDIVTVGKYSTSQFKGTIYKPRIFDQLLTEAEHDDYHAGTTTSFFMSPLASYRCDDYNDDTDGNYIWDRTTNRNDLIKGDRSTSSTFPTYSTDKYLFDLVDDYVSGLFTLPTSYTVTAATSTPQEPYPVITQENDTTLLDDLTTSGLHWGYLHSLTIHAGELTQLQLYHAEYQHQYWQRRGRAYGAYNRLITENVCILAQFLDSAEGGVYQDYSRNLMGGIAHDVTRDGYNGCTFPSADSNVTFPYSAIMQTTDVTIVVYGDFTNDATVDSGLIDRDKYKFWINFSGGDTYLEFNNRTFQYDIDNNQQLVVTARSGEKPQFYVDGVFVGEGTSASSWGSISVSDLVVGNVKELDTPTEYALNHVGVYNAILTPREILALYEESQAIGATVMETGTRTRVRQVFTATAVDEEVDPGGPFQLIDITMIWNTAAAASEDITITSINGDTDEVTEHPYDPSLSSRTSHVFRFDKRFPDGTTIAIDYTNTDARTITVNTVYQTDPSIG
jgi:hypothetical protein